jgi:hypothetical protein
MMIIAAAATVVTDVRLVILASRRLRGHGDAGTTGD